MPKQEKGWLNDQEGSQHLEEVLSPSSEIINELWQIVATGDRDAILKYIQKRIARNRGALDC